MRTRFNRKFEQRIKMPEWLGYYNYWIYIILMMIGFYGIIAKRNLIKQAICLSLFQTGIFLFYISMAVVSKEGESGTAPIYRVDKELTHQVEAHHEGEGHSILIKEDLLYDNPLPHVLILTAIVVSISTLAVALALVINIQRSFRSVEEDEIREREREMDRS